MRTVIRRLLVLGVVVALATAVSASAAVAAGAVQDPDLRLFLRDGTAVAIEGEYARVGDRVVFTLALNTASEAERLRVVSLPATAIDWPKTDEYGAGVRAARYAKTQGEADYTALTVSVARALSGVADRKNPLDRLQLVEQARGIVATWGREHYGYRANDVRQIAAMLDELVSELRAETGIAQFDLNLVAPTVEPPAMVPLPEPTLVQKIQQALSVAKASDVAADRQALMRDALQVLNGSASALPRDFVKRTRDGAADVLSAEVRADAAYRDLATSAIGRARAAAAKADSDRIARLLVEVSRRDERLGRKRPDEVAALMSALDQQLDAARRLRLARDRYEMLAPSLRAYERQLRGPLRLLARTTESLDAIRRLSGPDPDALATAHTNAERASTAVATLVAPEDLATVHATFVSACQLGLRATEMRRRAIETGDMQVAWDASSAAAGATMLLAQARAGLQDALRPPELR